MAFAVCAVDLRKDIFQATISPIISAKINIKPIVTNSVADPIPIAQIIVFDSCGLKKKISCIHQGEYDNR